MNEAKEYVKYKTICPLPDELLKKETSITKEKSREELLEEEIKKLQAQLQKIQSSRSCAVLCSDSHEYVDTTVFGNYEIKKDQIRSITFKNRS